MLIIDGTRFLRADSRRHAPPRLGNAVGLRDRVARVLHLGYGVRDHTASPIVRAFIDQVELLVAVDSKNTRELFRSFTQVDRFAVA